jgi:hypothetical protein
MTDNHAPEPTRADFYREAATKIRARAAKSMSVEARDALCSLAADYDRLANYVESFWGSSVPPETWSAESSPDWEPPEPRRKRRLLDG